MDELREILDQLARARKIEGFHLVHVSPGKAEGYAVAAGVSKRVSVETYGQTLVFHFDGKKSKDIARDIEDWAAKL